jgi:dihydroneopterin aldolase
MRGLRAVGYCGALPEEQARAQPFEVDLDIEADITQAGATDDLSQTVDYGVVCTVVESVIVTERFALMEALVTRIADVVLALDHVDAVTVTVRKLRPPVPQHLDTAGVTIRRVRV